MPLPRPKPDRKLDPKSKPKSRSVLKEELITYLASGWTKKQAERATGIPVRTIFTWLKDPAFAARIADARSEMIDAAIGHLTAAAPAAAMTIELLSGPKSTVDTKAKISACKSVFEVLARVKDLAEITKQLADIKREFAELKLRLEENSSK
jgi:hypothetical protein